MGRETGGKTGNRGGAGGSVERAGQLPRADGYKGSQDVFITAAANYVNQKLWF